MATGFDAMMFMTDVIVIADVINTHTSQYAAHVDVMTDVIVHRRHKNSVFTSVHAHLNGVYTTIHVGLRRTHVRCTCTPNM